MMLRINFDEKLANRYKVIFFDLFFTLVKPIYPIADKCEHNILGIQESVWEEVSEHQYYDRGIGKLYDPYKIIENIAHEINSDISHAKILRATQARIDRFKECLQNIDDDTINVLSKIKQSKAKIGLISNSDCIDKLGWSESPLAKYFDDAIFSCDAGWLKPDPRIFELGVNRFKVSPKDCLFIGDGGSDELKAAKKLGMTTVLTTKHIEDL